MYCLSRHLLLEYRLEYLEQELQEGLGTSFPRYYIRWLDPRIHLRSHITNSVLFNTEYNDVTHNHAAPQIAELLNGQAI
jgi:hypothetical protein